MAVEILGERWDSRAHKVSDQDESAVLKVVASGDEDDGLALSTIEAYVSGISPPAGLLQQDIDINPLGGGMWEATANFSKRIPKKTGDSTYNFDTGGATTKITHSLETTRLVPKSFEGPAPDFHGSIGVTQDGIDGCDITVPQYNFSETHYIAVADVDDSYKAALFNATGKTNNATWRTYDEGEVLFTGASGTQRGQDDWEITYKFSASPNATGITIGPDITIDKNGWEYLWVSYLDEVDTTASPPAMVKRPRAAYTERVYDSADFTTLGIGS